MAVVDISRPRHPGGPSRAASPIDGAGPHDDSTGAHTRSGLGARVVFGLLGLVLIAYAVTGIIGMIPITPGGLGIVEASLSGFLVLAGVDSGAAVLATLAYRLASYWLPLLAGPAAYAVFKRRYRQAPPSSADKAEAMPA